MSSSSFVRMAIDVRAAVASSFQTLPSTSRNSTRQATGLIAVRRNETGAIASDPVSPTGYDRRLVSPYAGTPVATIARPTSAYFRSSGSSNVATTTNSTTATKSAGVSG